MEDVFVLAELTVAEGREAEAADHLRLLCEETHSKDPGCELYALHRDQDDPRRFFMIEKWTSQDALARHTEATHLESFRSFDGFHGEFRVVTLTPTGFGDPGKGSL